MVQGLGCRGLGSGVFDSLWFRGLGIRRVWVPLCRGPETRILLFRVRVYSRVWRVWVAQNRDPTVQGFGFTVYCLGSCPAGVYGVCGAELEIWQLRV